jgi:hypothetical protein
MEDDSLSDNQKILETNSFLENKFNRNTRINRYNKRLYTFTSSLNIPNKKFRNKTFKQSPKSRNSFRKKTLHNNLFIYNKSSKKINNMKLNFHSNISPTLSTYDNEKEITKNNIEKEKMKQIHQKIYNLYNSYYKAYKNNYAKTKGYDANKTENDKNKKKTLLYPLQSPSMRSIKQLQLSGKKILSRSIETKSKTSKMKSSFKSNFNFISPNYKNGRKNSHNLLKSVPDKRWREKMIKLVNEIDLDNIPKQKLKGARVKLVSLLNKKKGIINENIYYISNKKIKKGTNPMLIKKPTNNIEMNNLIINSFGFGHNQIEFSKKLYDLNEVFFSLLETMKTRRAEIDIARFEREKRKYTDETNYKDYQKTNYELYFHRNNRDKWEKKFMLEQYRYKIPENEFQKFKKYEKNKKKVTFIENAKKLTSLINQLDAEEYESPDEYTHNYRSTKSNISALNFKRIARVLKILKNNEDEEQTGNIIIKPDNLRKEQKTIENELINIIGKSGKPRFVKNMLKTRTVDKYKSISGNFFGLPV